MKGRFNMEKKKKRVLSEAAKQQRREYQRKWRAENPDKVREIQRRYWEKQAVKNQNSEVDKDDAIGNKERI